MTNETLDRWIQRVTLAAMIAVAAALVTVGARLYGPRAAVPPPGVVDVPRVP
ncbi:hypothetical protein OWM54_05530 [Myxococcus sp. MISCRS1]|jgi:hypothetical protein|uniref:Uncharacterized protein n=1 Tax=Myxococcus fulvus TaxID=33 RepID=A0A511T3L2_MYXFU|nr:MULTISPECIES: hypothetical protein [Myxococcus]AKF85755.1 hypothetical protein MFUL124B02_15850 [Myxococcus fulvus 124B02]BDT33389.1 hypothetical protein MFMH1_30580 [Myxococcus sp. MH1]MBZ4396983.1 hypothetical protein [Myxococcus sp. AS-1-15]MBZ4408291.1 hypothetical protein [Myxococcus sp. XM-1-1-1]MCK8496239.1 hypothetical protein [Myxococcus fulvus]